MSEDPVFSAKLSRVFLICCYEVRVGFDCSEMVEVAHFGDAFFLVAQLSIENSSDDHTAQPVIFMVDYVMGD